MRTLGIGIIGLHHLHPTDYLPHFRAIPNVEVRTLSEADDSLRRQVCDAAGVPGHTDYAELVGRDDVDLVAIFLPHAECAEAAESAARSGKHVIVEKPMADTSDNVRRMVLATAEAGVTLSSPYCWRYHPAAQQVRQVVSAGVLGQIIALEGRCMAGGPDRYLENGISPWLNEPGAGGGPMHNLGVHWIDLFRWLLQAEVESASAMVSHAHHGLAIEDNSLALLQFEGGAISSLDISYSAPSGYPAGRDLYIGIRGTLGTLSWSPAWGGTADEIVVCSDHPDYADAPRHVLQIASRTVTGYAGICGLAYLRSTVEAVGSGRTPEVTGTDGLRALEVVEAVYAAAATGRRVDVVRSDP